MVILLNRLTVTGDPDKFEEVFAKSSQFMRTQPGFMGHTLVRSLRNPGSYVNIAHWEQAADHIQSVQNPEFIVCGPRRRSRAAFTAYRAVAAVVGVERDAAFHRTKTAAKAKGIGLRMGMTRRRRLPRPGER